MSLRTVGLHADDIFHPRRGVHPRVSALVLSGGMGGYSAGPEFIDRALSPER